jgi:hypothetical protein
MEAAQKLVAVLHGQHGIVEPYFGDPRDGPEQQIFDARLRGRGQGDAFSIAAQARCQPQDVNFLDRIDKLSTPVRIVSNRQNRNYSGRARSN